jgi:hypothetical protein
VRRTVSQREGKYIALIDLWLASADRSCSGYTRSIRRALRRRQHSLLFWSQIWKISGQNWKISEFGWLNGVLTKATASFRDLTTSRYGTSSDPQLLSSPPLRLAQMLVPSVAFQAPPVCGCAVAATPQCWANRNRRWDDQGQLLPLRRARAVAREHYRMPLTAATS